MVGQRIDGETLVMVGKEDADKFARATIALESRANIGDIHLATQFGKHKGDTGILSENRVFVGDVPDVLPKLLQVAELNTCRVLCIYFDNIIEQGSLFAFDTRTVFRDENAHYSSRLRQSRYARRRQSQEHQARPVTEWEPQSLRL